MVLELLKFGWFFMDFDKVAKQVYGHPMSLTTTIQIFLLAITKAFCLKSAKHFLIFKNKMGFDNFLIKLVLTVWY